MRRCLAHVPWMAMALLVLVPLSEGMAYGQGFPGRRDGRLARAGLEVGSTLPALSVYDTTGTNVALSSLLAGHYTVLVTGCLTCPVFLRTYPDVEAVHRDYASKGVQFYYLYKALAHPENNGYVQPFTLDERFAHIEEARRKLGTQIPWLSDPMTNEVSEALAGTPNSEFVFDPDGKIVYLKDWSDALELRATLEALVGPVEHPTEVADLHLPEVIPRSDPAEGVVARVEVPEQLIPIKLDPQAEGEAFYLKLRAEVDEALLASGSGQMYLGFHLDPIHHVHWNNLVDPVRYEVTAPAGTTVTPSSDSAPTVEQPSDNDPREFLVDVQHWHAGDSLALTVLYFACDEEDRWCRAVTQHYTMHLERDSFGGGVIGRSFRGPGRQGGRRGGFDLMSFDADEDGQISKEEAPDRLKQRFDQLDSNGDGFLDEKEFQAMRERMRRGRGPGG